jgi:serine/threonine protein kinase
VLPPEKVTDPDRKHRFVQEARAASALNHPNIVTIHDIGQADGVDFIAMEYVEGKTLDELIGRKGLNEALRIAIQIADALAKAHAAGIVHRDLKPGNVMVTAEGRVKVLDFGLAKLTETASAGPEDATVTERHATELGMIVGTAAYMSPEQAEGKTVDPAATSSPSGPCCTRCSPAFARSAGTAPPSRWLRFCTWSRPRSPKERPANWRGSSGAACAKTRRAGSRPWPT